MTAKFRAMIRFAMLPALALSITVAAPAKADTLVQKIRASGMLTCGINTDEIDYSKSNSHGNVASFGADACRAAAAAILGPRAKVAVSAYPDEPAALRAVQSGKIALFVGGTPTAEAQSLYHIAFAAPLFYDGQGFLVNREVHVEKLTDFAGKQICFIEGTQADDGLISALEKKGIKYFPFPFEEQGEMEAALVTGHCAAVTADVTKLANTHSLFRARARDFTILAETISRDPLAPAYSAGESQFGKIVNATMSALMLAESNGITKSNVTQLEAAGSPAIARLSANIGTIPVGLSSHWAVDAIAMVGNYGEMYERDLGKGSALKLDRGPNTLQSQGGLLTAS